MEKYSYTRREIVLSTFQGVPHVKQNLFNTLVEARHFCLTCGNTVMRPHLLNRTGLQYFRFARFSVTVEYLVLEETRLEKNRDLLDLRLIAL